MPYDGGRVIVSMPDLPGPYAGQGGSYIKRPDGTKDLEFRTGVDTSAPAEDSPAADVSTTAPTKLARKD
jgi:hypothetical protein